MVFERLKTDSMHCGTCEVEAQKTRCMVMELISKVVEGHPPFDPTAGPAVRREQLERFEEWYKKSSGAIRYYESSKRFKLGRFD